MAPGTLGAFSGKPACRTAPSRTGGRGSDGGDGAAEEASAEPWNVVSIYQSGMANQNVVTWADLIDPRGRTAIGELYDLVLAGSRSRRFVRRHVALATAALCALPPSVPGSAPP